MASKERTSVIVARDTTPYVTWLGCSPEGDALVIEQPGLAEPPGRLLRRASGTWEILAELPGVNGPAALSPDGGTLLAEGPLWGGEPGSTVLVDLQAMRITHTLPLTGPYAWVDARRFVAQTLRFSAVRVGERYAPGATRKGDPALIAAWPGLLSEGHGMAVVDLDTLTARPVLSGLLLDPERCCAISGDREVLYSATRYARISAVRLSDGGLLWQRPPVRTPAAGTVAALTLRDGALVASGLGDVDLRVLDARGGALLHQEALGHRPGFPTFHELSCALVRADGRLVLASDQGALLTCARDGSWTAVKVAGRAIQALVEGPDGRLLVGGAERNLRLVA